MDVTQPNHCVAWFKRTYSKPERWLFLALLSYFATAYGTLWLVGAPVQGTLYLQFVHSLVAPALVLAACARAIYIMFALRPEKLFAHFAQEIQTHLLTTNLLAKAIPTLILLTVFLSLFTSVKASMPLLSNYGWDESFAVLDRTIHFGYDPWRLLAPLLHQPVITYGINLGYNIWLYVVFGILLWQTFDFRNPQLRIQFLLAFVATWILLGNLLAIGFGSGGPAFFDHFVGASVTNPFSEQLRYLRVANESHEIWALSTQQFLLDSLHNEELKLGVGISAMPSVHVASTTLLALLAVRTNRFFGVTMIMYLAAIMLGSVHLAWHYAIDGYFSILLTLAIWTVIGKLIRYSNLPSSSPGLTESVQ